MGNIKLELTQEGVALIDAALSLLHQNVVSQIGAIKESNQVYGETDSSNEILKGAEEVKNDIERMFKHIQLQQSTLVDAVKLRKIKRFKKR